MSQTEALMLIALGFALAFIVVLLFGRAVWTVAMRLGARRQAKQIPVAMIELQADRDRLRADHAMMSRKLELRLEDSKTRMTEQMAEVSRHRNRLRNMVGDIERRDELIAIKDKEIATLSAKLEISDANLSACYDKIEKLTALNASREAQIAKHSKVSTPIANTPRETTIHPTNRVQDLQTALHLPNLRQPPAGDVGPTENRLMQRVAELTSISSQMTSQQETDPFAPQVPVHDVRPHQPLEIHPRQPRLDQQLVNTDHKTLERVAQLNSIDAMSAPAILPAPEPIKKSGAMANVISLAQRIKALQKISD